MKNKTIKLQNETGLHARPASKLAKLASEFKSSVKLNVNGKSIDAKSILAIMSTGIKTNTQLEIVCEGEDEEEAIKEIVNAFENNFDE